MTAVITGAVLIGVPVLFAVLSAMVGVDTRDPGWSLTNRVVPTTRDDRRGAR